MRRRSAGYGVVLLLAVTAAAGCGTTVDVSKVANRGNAGAGTGGTQSLALPSSAAPSAGGAAGAVAGPNGAAALGAAPGSGATTAGVEQSGSRTSGAQAASAPGVTATTIYIGVKTCSSCGASDQVIGAAGAAPSYDYRSVFNAAAAYANAHGGFAGRKLQAIYYDYNATNDTGTQDQAACSHWTQDNKVFAVYGTPASDDILRACAEHAGAISIGTGGAEIGSTFSRYPHYVDIDGLALDRLALVTVNGLARAKYFTGKLGLVTWDDPAYKYAMDHGYLPTLAAHHIAVSQTAYIAVPQQLNAVTDTSAAVSSAVTKFKTLGIDHVIVQDGQAGVFGGTGLTLEWMEQSKSQDYYPRYGQNSGNSPGWSVLPSDQMDTALAVDQTDLNASYDAGWHTNAAREKCYKIEADAGYPVSSSNLNDEVSAGASCDIVFLLQRIINALPQVTSSAVINALGSLGTSFGSAQVYGTKFSASIHDGGGMVRTEEYSASCQCLHYLGPPYYAD